LFLSADGVTLKVRSCSRNFRFADPKRLPSIRMLTFKIALYLTLQMAVREIVGKEKIDTLIENRRRI